MLGGRCPDSCPVSPAEACPGPPSKGAPVCYVHPDTLEQPQGGPVQCCLRSPWAVFEGQRSTVFPFQGCGATAVCPEVHPGLTWVTTTLNPRTRQRLKSGQVWGPGAVTTRLILLHLGPKSKVLTKLQPAGPSPLSQHPKGWGQTGLATALTAQVPTLVPLPVTAGPV